MRMSALGACVLALLVVACGGTDVMQNQTDEAQGTLQLPLTSPGPDGKTYRLLGATFEISGPQSVSIADTPSDTLNVPLPVGTYAITLGGNYRLEATDAPGKAVAAELISPTTLTFDVAKGTTTQVRFQFKLAGSGTADVGFSVDKGGYLSGTLHFADASGSPDGDPLFRSLVGKDVPFTLSYSMATVSKGGYRELTVQTGPVTLQFGGPDSAGLTRQVARVFDGQPLNYSLRAEPDGRVRFLGFQLVSPTQNFILRVNQSELFAAPLDSEGYPLARPFQFITPALPDSVRLQGPPAYGEARGWILGGKGTPN